MAAAGSVATMDAKRGNGEGEQDDDDTTTESHWDLALG